VRPGPACTRAGPAMSQEGDEGKDALAELSQKVVQLTKVVVFLHTRSDGHDARCAALRKAAEDEVRRVATAAAACVEAQRRQTEDASRWRERSLEALERRQREREEEAARAATALRHEAGERETLAIQRLSEAEALRGRAVEDLRHKAERVCAELAAAQGKARTDRQWLSRHLAGEAARERQLMDERFAEISAQLRSAHALEVEELRATREAAIAALRAEHDEDRTAALAEADQELSDAVALQEKGFESERRCLQERVESARATLAAARGTTTTAKGECAEQQRLLDEMSRELQERKRRGHALAAEADRAHTRKLKAESEARELRRQKASIERALGGASAAPQTERAVAGLSEDVRSAQARLEALRNELGRSQRLHQERRAAVAEREEQAERLAKEFAEERRRSDELQRVLLRLEQSG